jgi:hypothetical protein
MIPMDHPMGLYDVRVIYTEASSADTGISINYSYSKYASVDSESAVNDLYTTKVSQAIGAEDVMNFVDFGETAFPTSTNNILKLKCNRDKVGTGRIIMIFRFFDLQQLN